MSMCIRSEHAAAFARRYQRSSIERTIGQANAAATAALACPMVRSMEARWYRRAKAAACSLRMHMDIEQIQVGFRYRKDLGDLRALAQSIEEVGLLHPVVVTPEGRLIAGQRRLQACRTLGWTAVPVTVVDLYQAARGEAHENFIRKDLLPSEIVALKRAIEPLERRGARERQGGRGGALSFSPTG